PEDAGVVVEPGRVCDQPVEGAVSDLLGHEVIVGGRPIPDLELLKVRDCHRSLLIDGFADPNPVGRLRPVTSSPATGTPESASSKRCKPGKLNLWCSVGDPEGYSPTKGVDMPKVVITHAVQDIDRWLAGKSERAAAIESGTGSNVTDYVAQDGSKNIAITADVADLEPMKSMATAPPPEVA